MSAQFIYGVQPVAEAEPPLPPPPRVEAIVAGDSEQAVELLRQHIMIQGQRFAALVASLHQLKAAPEQKDEH